MSDYIVLDIETQELVQDWSKPWEAGLACCCVWDSGIVKAFGPNDLDALAVYLKQTWNKLLVTWNGDAFDIPLLDGLGMSVTQTSCDPAATLRGITGKRCRLESTARATLGKGKSGHGHSAPDLWKQGDLAQLHAYCINDVMLTRELFLFSRQYGYLVVEGDRVVPLSVPGCTAGPRKICEPPSKEPATQRQIAYIQRLYGYDWQPTPGFTKTQAAQLIDERLKAK